MTDEKGKKRRDVIKRTSRKRGLIVEAAAEVFFESGYESASMDSIAARAAVSKQTLYNNFPGKEALFCEVVRAECENFTDELASIDVESDLSRVLTGIARSIVDSILRPRTIALFRLLVAQTARQTGLAQEFYEIGPRKAVRWLAGYLESQIAKGRMHPSDPELDAEEFLGMVTMEIHFLCLFGLGMARPSSADVEKRISHAVDAFLRAYAAPISDQRNSGMMASGT